MVRAINYFTENADIARLLNQFKQSQGPLFHYKKKNIAISIVTNKEIQVSRADTFEDKSEINHGLEILQKTASKILTNTKGQQFANLIPDLKERLKSTYVFCMTQDNNNSYMLENYGDTVIELNENFSQELGNRSWHSIPYDDGYKFFYSTDLYSNYEGFVEYNTLTQEQLATEICTAIDSLDFKTTHLVDHIHLINILIKFVVLCKKERFSDEKEYRCILLANGDKPSEYEIIDDDRIFLKLRIPTDFKLHEK